MERHLLAKKLLCIILPSCQTERSLDPGTSAEVFPQRRIAAAISRRLELSVGPLVEEIHSHQQIGDAALLQTPDQLCGGLRNTHGLPEHFVATDHVSVAVVDPVTVEKAENAGFFR